MAEIGTMPGDGGAAPSPEAASVSWGPASTAHGVVQRRFDLSHRGRVVPGLVWTPAEDGGADAGAGDRPLVLIGHGSTAHKGEDYVLALARRLVRHHGMAAAAIDGPVHGDRRAGGAHDPGLSHLEFGAAWSSQPNLTDAMVEDWRAVTDLLTNEPGVAGGPVAYWGLSMGTILGLPFVAAEPRVVAAVLGLMGMTGPTRERIAADAAVISCPILFLVQLDDELFGWEKAVELFKAFASTDKRLHANPGKHSAVPAEEFAASEEFLARHLTPRGAG